jgi:hypothetical protein
MEASSASWFRSIGPGAEPQHRLPPLVYLALEMAGSRFRDAADACRAEAILSATTAINLALFEIAPSLAALLRRTG